MSSDNTINSPEEQTNNFKGFTNFQNKTTDNNNCTNPKGCGKGYSDDKIELFLECGSFYDIYGNPYFCPECQAKENKKEKDNEK